MPISQRTTPADVQPEPVPEATPEAAQAAADATPPDHVQAILDDHADWIAVADCLWLGQIAYRAGAKVSSGHPGLPQWIADKTVAPQAGSDAAREQDTDAPREPQQPEAVREA